VNRDGYHIFRHFRNDYLQAGGHDADVIARYSNIESRLHAYENYPWRTDYPEPLKQSRCLYFYAFHLFIDSIYL
jgi:hypothetical protein